MRAAPLSRAVLLLLTASACRARDDAPKVADRPVEGGTVVLGFNADLVRPFPLYFRGSEVDNNLQDLLFMSLLRAGWKDGRSVQETAPRNPMALATAYEYTARDSSVLRFHLRRDARWSDGVPVTAHDVAWTFGAIKDSAYHSTSYPLMVAIDSVREVDPHTVDFHFGRYDPQGLFLAAHPIAPAHAFEKETPEQVEHDPRLAHPEQGRMVVSGPFLVESRQPGTLFTLARNPRFRPRPRLERIAVRVVASGPAALASFRAGESDALSVKIDEMRELQKQPRPVAFQRMGTRLVQVIAYNPGTVPAFADPAVRRALGLAIDVPQMLRALRIDDVAHPAAGPYPASYRDFYDPARMRPLGYDTARARRLLDSAGWRAAPGDSIRSRGGKPLRFTLLVIGGAQRPLDIALFAQAQWMKLGVAAEILQLEPASFAAQVNGKSYQAVVAAHGTQLDPDLSWIYGDPASPENYTGYSSPRYRALQERARQARTPEESRRLWQEAALQVIADQPETFLYNPDALIAVSPALQGARMTVFSIFENPWEWWSPTAYQRRWASAPGPAAAPAAPAPR
jgi:peptide/nickel transport system substrate-binding protein